MFRVRCFGAFAAHYFRRFTLRLPAMDAILMARRVAMVELKLFCGRSRNLGCCEDGKGEIRRAKLRQWVFDFPVFSKVRRRLDTLNTALQVSMRVSG